MIKKIILLLLIVLSFLSLLTFAASDEEKIYISDFKFEDESGNENTLSPDAKIFARCNIERVDNDTKNDIPYEFVLQIRRNGKLISLTSSKGSIDVSDGVVPIEVEGYISGEVSNVEVSAYLFKDVKSLVPISNNAIYGSDIAEIEKITVNNTLLDDFTTDTAEYTYSLQKYPLTAPAIRFYPKDLSAITIVSGTFPNPITYKIVSSDNSEEKEYTINFDIAKKEKVITTAKHIEKARQTVMTSAKEIDPDSETVYTTNIRLPMNSYLSNSKVDANNVSKFTTLSYLTFDMTGCDLVEGEKITLTLRGKINKATMYDKLNICLYEYNPENDTPSFTDTDNGYLGEKITSLNIYNDGVSTSNNQYFDYTFDVTDFVLSEIKGGKTDITLALAFDSDEIAEIWNIIKAGNWPAGISQDFIFGFVTNTAATRKHNGTSIIYGDGQPKLHYYEYEREKNPVVDLTPDGATIEAEDAVIDDSFEHIKDTDASGGEYLLSNTDNRYVDMDRYEINEYFETNQVPLTLTLNCKEEGYYNVYMRVLSKKGQGDFYQRLNKNGSLIRIAGSKELFTEDNKFT